MFTHMGLCMTQALLAKTRLFLGTNAKKNVSAMSFSLLWHFTEFELIATEHLIERFFLVCIVRVVGPQCSVDTQLRLQTHYHSISFMALAGISLHTHTLVPM